MRGECFGGELIPTTVRANKINITAFYPSSVDFSQGVYDIDGKTHGIPRQPIFLSGMNKFGEKKREKEGKAEIRYTKDGDVAVLEHGVEKFRGTHREVIEFCDRYKKVEFPAKTRSLVAPYYEVCPYTNYSSLNLKGTRWSKKLDVNIFRKLNMHLRQNRFKFNEIYNSTFICKAKRPKFVYSNDAWQKSIKIDFKSSYQKVFSKYEMPCLNALPPNIGDFVFSKFYKKGGFVLAPKICRDALKFFGEYKYAGDIMSFSKDGFLLNSLLEKSGIYANKKNRNECYGLLLRGFTRRRIFDNKNKDTACLENNNLFGSQILEYVIRALEQLEVYKLVVSLNLKKTDVLGLKYDELIIKYEAWRKLPTELKKQLRKEYHIK